MYLGAPILLSKLLIEPTNSLINQSIHSRSQDTPVNGDGFGVAWYAHDITRKPGLFRSLLPAWSNSNLARLARVTRSGAVLAHVRAATQGIDSAELNCHPFVHEQYALAHNGDIAAFPSLRRALEASLSDDAFAAVAGSTDSERLFALLVDALRDHAPRATSTPNSDPDARLMADALRTAIARVARLAAPFHAAGEHSYLNLALTDGVRGVACRWSTDSDANTPTLYLYRRGEYSCEGGVCRITPVAHRDANPHPALPPHSGAVVISSETLTDDHAWEPLPLNHLVTIAADRTITIEPVGIRPDGTPSP
jgi:predicted glutamine amidotransferase